MTWVPFRFERSRFRRWLLLAQDVITQHDEQSRLRREEARQQGPLNATSAIVTVDARAGQEIDAPLVFERTATELPFAQVGGVVTGRVTDDTGGPADGLTVQLWSRVYVTDGLQCCSPTAIRS